MAHSTDQISVCICTYKRPELLKRLLDRLEGQKTDGLFSISVVVVDNDAQESGREPVQAASAYSKYSIDYYIEPERNISLARNRSVEGAQGNLIAFIDDDEFPEHAWLLAAYKTLQDFCAAGILGPVRPHFDLPAPKWLIKSRLCERREFSTGCVLTDARYTRTGNVLLRKSIFSDKGSRFDPIYGRTGGGDAIFFKRMMEKGNTFVWCNEALVYETVTSERQKKSYYIKRAFTRGMAEALETPLMSLSTLRSIAAIPIYSLILPFALFLGQHVFMKMLVKECDHLGKLLAQLGIRPIKERPY
jgi:glycosyltransferase involved in cell wall biosynthesis